VLCPLSYGRMGRPAGFEPATTRLTAEVSVIFTTEPVFRNQESVVSDQRLAIFSCLITDN